MRNSAAIIELAIRNIYVQCDTDSKYMYMEWNM